MMMLHDLGIRGFLWLFYGAVFGFVFFPDLMIWLADLMMWFPEFPDVHSFRPPVILGIGAGIAETIFGQMSVDRQSFDKLSVGGGTGILLGVALLILAYSIYPNYDISLEELSARERSRIWAFYGGGAYLLTWGVIGVVISRFREKSG
jgi:hypothetical protein